MLNDATKLQLPNHTILDQIDHNSLYFMVYWVIIFNCIVLISEISGYLVVLDLFSILHNVKRVNF